ncbi:MAG TPA: ABC transporter permease [Gammaproteobacteria bacterium]|nr:ABC transporter permease [Gammaproteobacteria bacterium]
MNAALLHKELRDLLPWGILGLALGASHIVEQALTQVDLAPLGRTFYLLNDFHVVAYWLIAFAIGSGLAVREHDDRTLGFLDGLPVSRSRVFAVKLCVMALFVLVGPLIELATNVTMHLLSRGALDRELHPVLLLQALALQAVFVGNGLLLGAAIGRLRSLTWLVVGLAATTLILIVERVPRAAVLNPLSLLDWQWTDGGIGVDGQTVRTQLAVAVAAALVAWHGFVRAGKAGRPLNVKGPVAGAIVAVATLAALTAAVLLTVQQMTVQTTTAGPRGAQSYEFASSPPARTETAHYRISYPAHEAEAALALAAQADEIFEQVHALLGVPLGDPIDVDTSGSAPNTHGTAFLGRLRMRLDTEVAAVLAHETAHVVSRRAAGDERAWLWEAASVLNEGLASWVETRFRAREQRGDERMLVLAAMLERRELAIEELASPALLRSVRDENVKYPAGEALIAALVTVYGESAVPRLLHSFADPRLPSDLRGVPLWQATFQLAGFDLAAVTDEFYRSVEAFGAAHADELAALPRPRAVVVRAGGRFGAMAVIDGTPIEGPDAAAAGSPELVMRFRPAPDSSATEYRQLPAVANRPVWPGARYGFAGRLCVQPGVTVGAEVLFEAWTCLPTSDGIDAADLGDHEPGDEE